MRLYLISRQRCEETPSTNKKKFKTGLHTLNTFNQFCWNLTMIMFHQKASFVIFYMISFGH